MAEYTEKKKISNRKWDSENLDRISIAAPKGTKERWKQAAEKCGQSLNHFIYETVEKNGIKSNEVKK